MRVLAAAGAALSLSGCGFMYANDVPEYVRHPDTAYHLEGEVRDEATLAAIPDAVVTIETDRPGYVRQRRADAGGRFSIGYSAMLRQADAIDLMFDPADAVLVSEILVRAEGGGRCSRVHRFPAASPPASPFVLLVGDCATHRARASAR